MLCSSTCSQVPVPIDGARFFPRVGASGNDDNDIFPSGFSELPMPIHSGVFFSTRFSSDVGMPWDFFLHVPPLFKTIVLVFGVL